MLDKGVMDDIKLALEGVGMLSVSVIGLVLNCTSVVVFSRQRRHRTFHRLLLTLAIVDSVYLVCLVTTFSLPIVSKEYREKVFAFSLPWTLPFAQVSQMASVYLTMALTVERYLVVCKPFKYIQLESISMFIKLAASSILFATLFNLPHFFHHFTSVNAKNVTNFEDGNETRLIFTAAVNTTEFRKDPLYIKIYVAWLNLIFSIIIPFSTLFILNFRICRSLMQPNSILRRTGESSLRRRERGLVMTCLAIVVVFLSCHTLKMVLNIVEVRHIDENFNPSWWGDILIHISHFLLTLNSSINYIIYRISSQSICGRTRNSPTNCAMSEYPTTGSAILTRISMVNIHGTISMKSSKNDSPPLLDRSPTGKLRKYESETETALLVATSLNARSSPASSLSSIQNIFSREASNATSKKILNKKNAIIGFDDIEEIEAYKTLTGDIHTKVQN